ASLTEDVTLSAEGDSQSVAGTAVDVAGNSASTTFEPIRIDKTDPSTTADVNGATKNDSGWYTGDVVVTLTALDQTGLSGVASTTYRIDDGDEQTYDGTF